jgi:hypothetical protein
VAAQESAVEHADNIPADFVRVAVWEELFREVLVGDGLAAELVRHDGLHLGERVQPGQEDLAGLAVSEAVVDLFTDFEGEAGDFASHGIFDS